MTTLKEIVEQELSKGTVVDPPVGDSSNPELDELDAEAQAAQEEEEQNG